MSDTPGRLLTLLSLLQTPREWPGSELAQRLGVTPRTVRRDVDRLRDLGYPVEATLGSAGGYRLVAGAALPPLLLDDDEAVAIAVGLRAAAGSAVAGIEEASVRALGKLEQVLPSRLRHRVRTIGAATLPVGADGPVVDPEVLTALAAAAANRERARFRYTSGDETGSSRLVEPLALVPSGRRWYLVAWDVDRADWRTFRVDRIARVQPTGVRVREQRTLPADDAAGYVAGRRTDWGTPELRVVVSFDAPVREVAGRLGDQPGQVVADGDAHCRLDARRDDSMEWLASRLVALGCAFTVHAPTELASAVRALGERAAAAAAPAPRR
ncbi:helix-turn-helix transcriptional regulator [Jiangella muralis]|uniref:helix-turn-helix transcriptional regulator n=1 Tax=Jiangella muralis TaxID=702383 RepID=UPI00069F0DCD|nr:YafY family protein [Jiangella muralis]